MVNETERLILKSLKHTLLLLGKLSSDEGAKKLAIGNSDEIEIYLNPTKKEHDFEKHI